MERTEEKIFEEIKNCRTISVIGLAKNVGKTTVVNFLLSRLKRVCVVTIGRDGEERDTIFNTPKPGVHIPKNSFAVVPGSILPEWGEILETFDVPSGKVALVRAKMDVDVQTIRMGSFETTAKISERLMNYCKHVVVDGAFGRTGIASYTDCAIIVTGAEVGQNVEEVISKTVKIIKRITTPSVESDIAKKLKNFSDKIVIGKDGKLSVVNVDGVAGHEKEIVNACDGVDFVYLPGAVDDEIASKLKCDIVVPSSEHIFSDRGKFKVLNSAHIVAVAVNATSVKGFELDSKELTFELQKRLNGIIVFDALYT